MRQEVECIGRSYHFVPGANERMLRKALDIDADCLIFDLEDAVAPAKKREARLVISHWLANEDFGDKYVAVRINPLDSDWGRDDLLQCMQHPPHAFVVPKVESLEILLEIDQLLTELEISLDRRDFQASLIPIAAETPLAAINVSQLHHGPRLGGITWGSEDLMSAVGGRVNRGADGRFLSLYETCRNNVLLTATAAKVPAIDTVYADLDNMDGLREECEHASTLGFSGKLTIHPNQISVVNDTFTPSSSEIGDAQRLIEAFAEAQSTGTNTFRFEGRMVDSPHLAQAEKIVRRARIIGVL